MKGRAKSGLVFQTEGGGLVDHVVLNKWVQGAAESVGDGPVHTHLLRHACASIETLEGRDWKRSREPRLVKTRPIEAIVERFEDKTKTVQYRPQGDPSDWEIGEPYVPFEVLEALSAQIPPALRLVVEWDLSSPFESQLARDRFEAQPGSAGTAAIDSMPGKRLRIPSPGNDFRGLERGLPLE